MQKKHYTTVIIATGSLILHKTLLLRGRNELLCVFCGGIGREMRETLRLLFDDSHFDSAGIFDAPISDCQLKPMHRRASHVPQHRRRQRDKRVVR